MSNSYDRRARSVISPITVADVGKVRPYYCVIDGIVDISHEPRDYSWIDPLSFELKREAAGQLEFRDEFPVTKRPGAVFSEAEAILFKINNYPEAFENEEIYFVVKYLHAGRGRAGGCPLRVCCPGAGEGRYKVK